MKNFLLIFVAIILLVVLSPIGLVYAIAKAPNLSLYWRGIAESIDQLGNHVMQHAFNKWLIKDYAYRFGDIDETVSSVLGRNKALDRLTKTGIFLDNILERLDPNHSLDAIELNP